MIYKLTIDGYLLTAEDPSKAMKTLKRWKEEGKVELVDVDPPKTAREQPYGWPGAPPKPPSPYPQRNMSRGRLKKDEPGSPGFKGIASVLFPHKDPQKLSMTEINDVAHLLIHHASKNELFVTPNQGFIDGGKRERLKTAFGIIAMTPDEAVSMLSEMEGWK